MSTDRVPRRYGVESVAFCGLGRMGVPMARNLAAAGFPLALWNRTRARAEELAAELGADVAVTPADAARRADVVISMLADGAAADRVYRGEDGLVAGLRNGATVIDMSTIGASKARELDYLVRGSGAAFVEAPVSGSVTAAASASLAILAGGEEAHVEKAAPILQALGRATYHVGPVGAAAIMKLAVNAVIFALNQSISEALVFAEKAGIDRLQAYAIFADSAIAAPFVHYRREEFERPGETEPTFLLRLAKKDLDLALDEADAVGAELPQTTVNRSLLAAAVAAGYGDANMTATADMLRGGYGAKP